MDSFSKLSWVSIFVLISKVGSFLLLELIVTVFYHGKAAVYLQKQFPIIQVNKASDPDNDYEDSETTQRHLRALIFVLGHTVLTLSFVICVYLRKKICRKRIEEEAAAATAVATTQSDGYSISMTIATRKVDIHVMESFPQIIFPQNDAKFNFTDCHICLEEFKQGESLVMLPTCGHAYHKDCIHRWMATRNSCCPDCQHDYGSVSDHV